MRLPIVRALLFFALVASSLATLGCNSNETIPVRSSKPGRVPAPPT